jgi:plasmid stability protein
MVHTAVVLPADLIAQLKVDAKKSGHGMSAEIRARLRATYLMELSRGDLDTGALLHAIKHLSDFLARDLGVRWHQHPYAMAAFKAGVAELLARYQPQGDESLRPDTQVVGDPPDVVGRTHARLIGIAGHETEDDYDPTSHYDETDPGVFNKRKSASNPKKLKD